MTKDKSERVQESQDRSAFQIGDEVGEGGQRDIITDTVETPDEEFAGMAKTGEQTFAKDGQGAPKR